MPAGAADAEAVAHSSESSSPLVVSAKKSAGGTTTLTELSLDRSATVSTLSTRLAAAEHCDVSQVTLVFKGAVLKNPAEPLEDLALKMGGPDCVTLSVVYVVRSTPALPPQASSGSSSAAPAPVLTAGPAVGASQEEPAASAPEPGHRVLLLMRHGQCCNEGQGDELKALTEHGHLQAESSAKYLEELFSAGRLPAKRALLHSTSRRARETAVELPRHLPGIEVWNADILRETDPTANPLRAEDVFSRLFRPPPSSATDTLIIVAHNNIILYLLMRAAGVLIERAAQAWRLFRLRHASITRIDVQCNGSMKIVFIGAAGHIPHSIVTWRNIVGADMSAWKGGRAEGRHKLTGRVVVLVRHAIVSAEGSSTLQSEAVATHIKGLTDYMISGHKLTLVCTAAAEKTASAVATIFEAKRFKVFPDSIVQFPEAGFMEFFAPSGQHTRDAVVIVAEDGPLLYWLLRSLQMSPEEARDSGASYNIGHASITLINIKADGTTNVVTVGDVGHLPVTGG